MEGNIPSNLLRGSKPTGGIYFWGRLGTGIQSGALLHQAAAAGVSFANGEIFYSDGTGSDHLRLCFASVPAERIEEGIIRLAKTLKDESSTRHAGNEQKIPLV